MTLVAGVDSSTQSCKVVIRDASTGALVRSGRASHPEGTEVDPSAWWGALLSAFADAGGLDEVAAISVAGQQHGMVVLDAEGRVIRDALLWNDTRIGAGGARPDRRGRRRRVRPPYGRRAGRLIHGDEAAVAARRRARGRGARRRRRAPARLADVAASRLRPRGRVAARARARRAHDRPLRRERHGVLGRGRLRPRAARARRSGTTRCCRGCSSPARRRGARPTASSSARVRATTRVRRSASTRHPVTSSSRSARAARSSP